MCLPYKVQIFQKVYIYSDFILYLYPEHVL